MSKVITEDGKTLINGAEPPKNPDGTYEEVNEEIFNKCGDCGEELDPGEAGDAFGTEWASCEACCNAEDPDLQ